jgi:hypothetical protein
MRRMWINQPSTLQPFHEHHGKNVLYDGEYIWFTSGAVINSQIPNENILSEGWK